MAYESGVIGGTSGPNDFILKAKNFLEANGWTITFFGLYSGNNILYVTRGGAYFCLYYGTTATVRVVGHTGYTPGILPTTQPGASAYQTISFTTVGLEYLFVTFGDSFYHYIGATASVWNPGGFCLVSDKIGAWTDGMFISGNNASMLFTGDTQFQSIRANGAWTAISSAGVASGFYGSVTTSAQSPLKKNIPCEFNAAILAVPITICRRNVTTGSLLHPLGFAPNIKVCNGGDIYSEKDILNINGESWMIMPRNTRGDVSDAFLLRVA